MPEQKTRPLTERLRTHGIAIPWYFGAVVSLLFSFGSLFYSGCNVPKVVSRVRVLEENLDYHMCIDTQYVHTQLSNNLPIDSTKLIRSYAVDNIAELFKLRESSEYTKWDKHKNDGFYYMWGGLGSFAGFMTLNGRSLKKKRKGVNYNKSNQNI
ncbi:MAG: hypothetical protein WC916_04160 [Candidatus Woesearchaeota archaeon]